MPDVLAAGLLALMVAAIQLATVELRVRAARRERLELAQRVDDVQRHVGADRRIGDERPVERGEWRGLPDSRASRR